MDHPLYDIYITGKLVEGADPETAKANFIKLFKTSPEATAKFFSGKPQVLKRGVAKAEALKYKAALHKTGLMVAFKTHEGEAASTTASEKTVEQANTMPATDDWSLAPVGSDVLKPDERREVAAQEIDTSAIKMVSIFAEPEPPHIEPRPAPDTSHISVAEVGADLLVEKPEPAPPLPLDLNSITLAPPGSELEELHDDTLPLDPDTSGLSMADVGVDILEGQTKAEPPPPPNTDHLKVAPE